MTVKELFEFLQSFDENKPVGFLDHFGKFIPLEYNHIKIRRVEDWKPTKSALIIQPPDIGSEPE